MRNLVPTTITDKNGRVTTVHRKPKSEARSIPAVPAPSSAVSTVNKQSTEVVQEVVSALGMKVQFVRPDFLKNIASLSDEDVALLREVISSPPPNGMGPAELQGAMSFSFTLGDSGRHMRNTTVLLQSKLPTYRHHKFLGTLGKTKRFKEAAHDLYTADDETKNLVCGIANAIHMLRNKETIVQDKHGNESVQPMVNTTSKYLRFSDNNLFQTIIDRPEHAEAIAALYLERGSIDSLDEVFSVIKPIQEGAL